MILVPVDINTKLENHYRRDVTVLAIALCPSVSVRLSQSGIVSKRLTEFGQSWVFGMEVYFHLSCTLL